jgi:phospholipid transport system substrate-binding protein
MLVSKRNLLAAGVSLAPLRISAPALAQAQSASPAVAPIESFNASLLGVMKAGSKTPFSQRFQMLAPAVDQTFDLERILRVSVGSGWSTLPPAQQQRLLAIFRAFTIVTYVANFHSYKGRTITVAPTTRAIGASQIVSSTIHRPQRDSVRIDYVMADAGGAWKVQDILLDGSISRVAVQRSDFASLVSPGNASRLIALLSKKVSVLSNGAVTFP